MEQVSFLSHLAIGLTSKASSFLTKLDAILGTFFTFWAKAESF